MNRKNIETIQQATLKTLAAQVERTLEVAGIRGWVFPRTYDIGVTIIDSTPLSIKIKARMDATVIEATIASTNVTEDITKISDDLVGEWLAAHAVSKPTKKRRATSA